MGGLVHLEPLDELVEHARHERLVRVRVGVGLRVRVRVGPA